MSGIQMALLGFAGFTPVTNTYTSGTGATETVPAGATSVSIVVNGGGGAGGYSGSTQGGGGGGGSQALRTIAVTGGNTFTYTVAASVLGRITQGTGIAGQASTVSGTVSGGSVSMTAGGGGGGTFLTGGLGGTATGGTTNTSGETGDDGSMGGRVVIVLPALRAVFPPMLAHLPVAAVVAAA
jgi:hypothetical protein